MNAGLGTAAVMGHPAAVPALAAKTAAKWLAPDLGKNLTYQAMNALKRSPNLIPKYSGQGLTQEMIDFVNSRRKQQ
jgi:hypothetical protein